VTLREKFAEIIGQKQAIALLKSAINRDRIAPAYLFTGISGIGRRLTAEAFAQALIQDPKSSVRIKQRNHPDVTWVEPTYLDKGKLLTAKEAEAAGLKRRGAPQIRLEQIRQVAEFLSHPPLESRRSLVIIEDAQTMAESAANGLLKTLEEPGKATIILIAPDAGSLLSTLVSRCQRIPFYALSSGEIQEVLTRHSLAIPDEILALAQGSVGNAIASLEQFQTIPAELLTKAQTIPQNPQQALTLAKQITKELEIDTQLWLIDYLQTYFWRSQGLVSIARSLEVAKKQLASYVQPRLIWEVMLVEWIEKSH